MPIPPAAFSPLTTTKSAPSSARRSPSMERTVRRPAAPTTSPTKRIVVKAAHGSRRRARGAYWRAMAQQHDRAGAGGVADPPPEPRPEDPPAPPPAAPAAPPPAPVEPVVVPR